MEPDVSIETSSMIRVAVLPIGDLPLEILRDYASLLLRHWKVDLSSIRSVYTENQKSPFTHQPWDTGSLRFKFLLGGASPSPWEDFQSNRKTLAVIGICHCPSSLDLDVIIDQFAVACKGYSSSLVQRCFAFCPNDSQLTDGSKKGDKLILVLPGHGQTQELHLQTMMRDIAALLLMEFEKWVLQGESAGTILKTPLDSQASLSSEEVLKAKKRRLGRAQKTIGDYCLLAGSPIDANAHYSTALELARLTGDSFWYGGALEGSVCALLLDRMAQQDPILEEEVKYRYNSVIMHYKKSSIQDNVQRVSPLSFELEATLKLARFLCRRELAREVVELLTNAADGAKSLIDENDRLILYVEIARLFGSLGYRRKAAFFSRQVAKLYLQQENRLSAISAMQVLAMTTEAYRVQSRAFPSKLDIHNEVGSSEADGRKIHHQSVVSLYESQWSTLQMVVLREILMSSVRAVDPLVAWSAAARLLRSYYPLITPAGQNGLATALANSAQKLPPGTRSADPSLPFVRLHSFPTHSSQMNIIKRDPARRDWWSAVYAPSGPFIYTPFNKEDANESNKQEMVWIVGEPIQVLVELANPCGFDLMVDSIYLSVQSTSFDAFPSTVHLPPNSSKVIMLSGIPSSVGAVTIPGCTVHCFGVITEHLFKDVDNILLGASQGIVLSDPFRCCGSPKLKNVLVPNILLVPPLPLLVSHVVGGDGAMILYEGEIRDVSISFANAGTVPVEEVHFSVSGRNQDSIVSIECEKLNSALPLKPGAQVLLRVTLKAWQLGCLEIDTAPGRSAKHSKDATTPMLIIHYAGPENAEESSCVGRRLIVPLHVCVLQGLSFVKARLLSMDIPSHVGETLPKPVPKISKTLAKIDPYRGSWGIRLLELELSNPTDSVFEICVCVSDSNNHHDIEAGMCYPKTRIDRDYCARVLIPLEHFKLPVLDASSLVKDMKAELDGSIRNLISRIKVRWESGRNSCGEVDIKDASLAALRSSVMDVLLPDPLTFGFRLSKPENEEEKWAASERCVAVHEMAAMEVIARNNTREMIRMSLSISCRDVAGHNCVEGDKAIVLWSGVLNDVEMEVGGLEESKHCLWVCFLVPGEYTLLASAVIENANEMLRARAKSNAPDDDRIICRGPPFHVWVSATSSL